MVVDDERRRIRPQPPGACPERVIGIDIDWLFASPTVRLSRWRCHEHASGITSERQQFWDVIGIVHSGAYQLRCSRGLELVDPMRVAFLNAFDPYQTSHPCGQGDRGSSLIVASAVLREMIAARGPRLAEGAAGPFGRATGPCPTGALLRQRSLLRRLESGEAMEPTAVESEALSIAEEILDAALEAPARGDGGRGARSRRDLAEEARALLGRGYRRPLHLQDLSDALGTSSFRLCKLFKEEFGEPVHRYLTRLRLRAALEALMEGERDLTGLALDVGFSSHSHLTFAFRREFGAPPSRFRPAGQSRRRARI
jgi:AraC-like DNA-binding protein